MQDKIIINPDKTREHKYRNCQISYDPAERAYYVQAVNAQQQVVGEPQRIEQPRDYVFYQKNVGSQEAPQFENSEEISIVQIDDSMQAYRRIFGHMDASKYNPINDTWQPGDHRAEIERSNAFIWHNQRNNFLFNDAQRFDADNPLSNTQKESIRTDLLDALATFKASCITSTEYENGLRFLVSGGDRPTFQLSTTENSFNEISKFLQFSRLVTFNFNNKHTYSGHFATYGEAKQYVQMVIQQALKTVDDAYQNVPIAIDDTGENNRLIPIDDTSSVDQYNAQFQPGDVRRQTYTWNENLTQTPQVMKATRESLRTINKIYDKENSIMAVKIKEGATLAELQEAQKQINMLMMLYNNEPNKPVFRPNGSAYKNAIVRQTVPFLQNLMSEAIAEEVKNTSYHEAFLAPLKQAITNHPEMVAHRERIAAEGALNPPIRQEDIPLAAQQPAVAPLRLEEPEPEPAPQPRQQPEIIEVQGKNLLDPGMRAKLQQWFDSKNLDELVDSADRKTLSGKLSNGARIAIHGSSIAIEKADGETRLTDEALEAATDEIADMLIKAYGGVANVPPLKVTGTDAQKELIAAKLHDLGLQVKGGRGQEDGATPGHEAGAYRRR